MKFLLISLFTFTVTGTAYASDCEGQLKSLASAMELTIASPDISDEKKEVARSVLAGIERRKDTDSCQNYAQAAKENREGNKGKE